MLYRKDLKKIVEPIAQNYALNKHSYTLKQKHVIQENLIKLCRDYCANSGFPNCPFSIKEDLYQCVALSIIQAIENYNPDKGKFLSFVIFYVKRNISRDDSLYAVTITDYFRQKKISVNKFYNGYLALWGIPPTFDEILKNVKVSQRALKLILDSTNLVLSLQPLDTKELENMTQASSSHDSSIVFKVDFASAMSKLTPDQRLVMDYFLNKEMSSEEIALEIQSTETEVKKTITKSRTILKSLLKEYATV